MLIMTLESIGSDSSWGVVKRLGLEVQEQEVPKGSVLVYGTSDPKPNPSELLLTQVVADVMELPWRFFVYHHGKNLPSLDVFQGNKHIFPLESMLDLTTSLKKIAEAVYSLRGEHCIVAYLPIPQEERTKTLRTDSKIPANFTIGDLHQQGGWLGGAAIHYILRQYSEKSNEVMYICPYQEKGRVYNVYRGLNRRLFVLTSFLRFVPPHSAGLPAWAPLPWWMWRALSASRRRRVRKAVNNLIRSQPSLLRIEISWEEMVK